MARTINKVILVGHLGQDAETTYTPAGTPVTKFSVATERRWKDQRTEEWQSVTEWTRVVLWRAEKLAKYLTKGKQVYVEGRLETRSYDKDGQKRYITEVNAHEVLLLGGARGEGGSRRSEDSEPEGYTASDNDVPF